MERVLFPDSGIPAGSEMFEQTAQHGRPAVIFRVVRDMVEEKAGAETRTHTPGLSQLVEVNDHDVHQITFRGMKAWLHGWLTLFGLVAPISKTWP